MRRSTILAAALAAGLALAGCGSDAAGNDAASANVSGVAEQLRAEEAQWNRDFAARDVERVVGHYSADAALAVPGAPLANGAAAIRSALTQLLADPNLRLEFASDRVQVSRSGELAYTRGHYTMQTTDPQTRRPRSESGSYLTVWQRQADGSWKVAEDFVTAGPAAAAAAPPPA